MKNFNWEALALILLLVLISDIGHCTVSKPSTNSIGIPQYTENPYTYLEGVVVDVSLARSGINLRIQPHATYELFTQSVLFCDTKDVLNKAVNKGGLLIFTYKTIAHRAIEGIGCHDIVDINEVKPEELQ